MKVLDPLTNVDEGSDCYLRQGDGGTKIARLGSRTCFLREFHNRSEAYFGQKSEEHVETFKKRHMEVNNNDLG